MGKSKVVVLGSLVGVALALAPLSSAFANDRFNGHWGHGGNWGGGHGYAVSGHGYGGHGYGYGGHGCYGCFWPVALAAGLGGWLVAAVGLASMPASPAWAIVAALIAVAFGQTFLPRSNAVARIAALSRSDLLGRMFAGAALTVAVTALSSALGAKWSGLLAVFPLLGIVLSVSSHRAHGPDFVVSLLRGMVLGRFSFAAFCLCLIFTLPRQAALLAFVEAAVLAMAVQWTTKRLAHAQHALNRKALTVPASRE